eukprot:Lithocolla_globosa_v1_NODE_1383_length_2618_cov_3.822083.p3 type:complete len:106 gc:universal NODE_1383_length_2618_cov_3.822083:1909-1592(-)
MTLTLSRLQDTTALPRSRKDGWFGVVEGGDLAAFLPGPKGCNKGIVAPKDCLLVSLSKQWLFANRRRQTHQLLSVFWLFCCGVRSTFFFQAKVQFCMSTQEHKNK